MDSLSCARCGSCVSVLHGVVHVVCASCDLVQPLPSPHLTAVTA